jgi:nitrite reductase/ring-hydroxylating ferredoxin subunit
MQKAFRAGLQLGTKLKMNQTLLYSFENKDSLQVGESFVFELPKGLISKGSQGFIHRHENGFSAFVNNCPHVNLPLDFDDGRFYFDDVPGLLCRVHGAVFNEKSGECVDGPCRGKSLLSLKLEEVGSSLLVFLES